MGYAYAVPFRKRPAYRYAVKHSIYVHPDHLHSGVGRLLLPALIEACAAAGFRQMFGYIDAEQHAVAEAARGLRLRARRPAEGVGFKFGRWTDSAPDAARAGAGRCATPTAADDSYSRTT